MQRERDSLQAKLREADATIAAQQQRSQQPQLPPPQNARDGALAAQLVRKQALLDAATAAFVDGAGVSGRGRGAGVGVDMGDEVGLPGDLEGAGEGRNDIDGFIDGAGAAVTTRSSTAASPAAPAPVTARILRRVAEETSMAPEERQAASPRFPSTTHTSQTHASTYVSTLKDPMAAPYME